MQILTDERQETIRAGDVMVLPSETCFWIVPETPSELSCVLLDPEYALDLIYWQYRGYLNSRLEAQIIAERLYSGARVIASLGRHLERLIPVLNSLVEFSAKDDSVLYYHQIQAHWFTLAQALTTVAIPVELLPQAGIGIAVRDAPPRPIRPEVIRVAVLLKQQPTHYWTLSKLASIVHLSPGHLSLLCKQAWGHTPRIRLQILRVEALAELLRNTDISVKQCIHRVGWRNHSHAAKVFRLHMGLSPGEYRRSVARYQFETSGDEAEGIGYEVNGVSFQ